MQTGRVTGLTRCPFFGTPHERGLAGDGTPNQGTDPAGSTLAIPGETPTFPIGFMGPGGHE